MTQRKQRYEEPLLGGERHTVVTTRYQTQSMEDSMGGRTTYTQRIQLREVCARAMYDVRRLAPRPERALSEPLRRPRLPTAECPVLEGRRGGRGRG